MLMYFHNEDQTLYPGSLEYNYCLVMNELTKIAEDCGAIIKPETPSGRGYVVNRAIFEKIAECENRIARLKEIAADEKLAARITKSIPATIKEYEDEIQRLNAIDNSPVRIERSFIHFVLDGVYYYFDFPDNPFFEHTFTKTPVVNGKISRDCYGVTDPKEWLFDSLFRMDCSMDDIKESANIIFNMLMNGKYSEKYRDGRRQRVPNTYNGGYHYETIYRPERVERLTWLTVEK